MYAFELRVVFLRFGHHDSRVVPSTGTAVVDIPEGIDWMIHRVATAGVYNDSLHEILSCWSLDDLADATLMLDALSRARRIDADA